MNKGIYIRQQETVFSFQPDMLQSREFLMALIPLGHTILEFEAGSKNKGID